MFTYSGVVAVADAKLRRQRRKEEARAVLASRRHNVREAIV
jgi:hypothetical protein